MGARRRLEIAEGDFGCGSIWGEYGTGREGVGKETCGARSERATHAGEDVEGHLASASCLQALYIWARQLAIADEVALAAGG